MAARDAASAAESSAAGSGAPKNPATGLNLLSGGYAPIRTVFVNQGLFHLHALGVSVKFTVANIGHPGQCGSGCTSHRHSQVSACPHAARTGGPSGPGASSGGWPVCKCLKPQAQG